MDMELACTRGVFITANVGSIFEEPETMFPTWLKAFFQCIQTHKPGLVAIHCQEVGGKNYEASMQHVNHFIKLLLACQELHKYNRARIFLDEDYTAPDKFTALGNLYFIHEDVTDVLLWDFVDCKFVEVEGREVLSGNIENVPIKEKAKFPQYFFPEFKWSRKGFLRTRWCINSCVFDLVNIHLFHDASNIVAMESSPSVYHENRQRALLHTLQRFENDSYSQVPMFIFGDFNFRLDSNLLIQELTGKLEASQTKGKKGLVNKIDYTELDTKNLVLTIGSKSFDYYDKHSDLFTNMNKWLHQYDTEFISFQDRLCEQAITFPPSYPFSEDVSDGISYMKTRVPSWCDRVLFTRSAKDIISQESSHEAIYDLIGKDVCMGDHKPVYLFIHMKPGKGNFEQQKSSSTSKRLSTREPFSQSLSINGEIIEGIDFSLQGVDLVTVNIHDYAVFEDEEKLIPEFKKSIKDRKVRDKAEGHENNNNLMSSPSKEIRNRSFHEVAREVVTLEKVLIQWLKRPRSRHHSSSSEDFPSDDCDGSDAVTDEAEVSDNQIPLIQAEAAHCSSGNGTECVEEGSNLEGKNVQQATSNKDSLEPIQDNSKSITPSFSAFFDTSITLENVETKLGLDKATDVFPEAGQTLGSGDDEGGGVVLLARHDGHVHEDPPTSPAGSVPQVAGQSCQNEPPNGKTGRAATAAPSNGCCSSACVVL